MYLLYLLRSFNIDGDHETQAGCRVPIQRVRKSERGTLRLRGCGVCVWLAVMDV